MVDAPTVDSVREFFQRPAVSRWGWYLLKAVVLLAIVAILSKLIPSMPPVVVGIIWALLSVLASLGIAYPVVMRKTSRQVEFREGSFLSRLNNGRTLRLAICFIAATFLMAGLLFESQNWDLKTWCIVALSAPLYVLVSIAVEKILDSQYEPMFHTKGIVLTSGVLTGLLMLALYAALVWFDSQDHTYQSLIAAYLNTPLPFKDSPTDLLRETGKIAALGDAATDFFAGQATKVSPAAGLGIRLALCASTFFGISSLLCLCALEKCEIKRIFQPLEKINAHESYSRPLRLQYVVWMIVLPIAFVGGFTYAEHETKSAISTDGYSFVVELVRGVVGVNVTEVNGQYYDSQKLNELRQSTKEQSDQIEREARSALHQPIVESFENRKQYNVNAYLDLHASKPQIIFESETEAERDAYNQFLLSMERRVDDQNIVDRFQEYADASNALRQDAENQLLSYQITDFQDREWLMTSSAPIDSDFLSRDLASSQKIVVAYDNLIKSVPPEDSSQAVATRIAEFAPQKQFMKDRISRTTSSPLLDLSIITEPVNRDKYRQEIEDCLDSEQTTLQAALGVYAT